MKTIVYALIATVLFSSCAATKITSNRDKEIDITLSKTYSYLGWTEVNDMVDVDRKVIEKAFAEELKQRGLTYVEFGGDIAISLFVVVDKESTQNRYNSYYGNGSYGYAQPTWGWGVGYAYGSYGGYANGYGVGPNTGVPYKENSYFKGTLVCDVFDKASKKLAWQAVLSKAIKPKKQNKTDVSKIAESLFKTFPIPKIED